MTLVEHLRAARELVARGWTQKCFARDENDRNVPCGGGACKWCMSGALQQAACDGGGVSDKNYRLAVKELMVEIEGHWITTWNDQPERTQQDVLDVYDRTIARLTSWIW